VNYNLIQLSLPTLQDEAPLSLRSPRRCLFHGFSSLCVFISPLNYISPYNRLLTLIRHADIWYQVTAGGQTSTAAIRQPLNNSPVENVNSGAMTCNNNPSPASQTLEVSAGSSVSFRLDNNIYHPGPAAIYLGQVPAGQTAATWNGSGNNWFKVGDTGHCSRIIADYVLTRFRLPSGALPSTHSSSLQRT